MKFINIVPTLPVMDVKETQDYYEKVFGFKPHWIWEGRFGSIYGGEAFEIHLDKTEPPFAKLTCYIYVEDADAYFGKISAAGAKIVEGIRSTPWGMREFAVEEINGHRFRIGQGEKAIKEIPEFKTASRGRSET